MFAKHPLDSRRRLDRVGAAEALRLAIIAELDAISTYLQFAEAVEDEAVRRVFLDVAREEKTHVGEFLELLKRLDPEQARELEEGAGEVEELLGGGGSGSGGASGSQGGGSSAAADPPGEEGGFESAVAGAVRRLAEEARVLRRVLPVTRLPRGVDVVPVVAVGAGGGELGVVEEGLLPLREVSVEFLVPRRVVERAGLLGEAAWLPLASAAAGRLVREEEQLLLESLGSAGGVTEASMGSWERPGEAVEDVARAVAAAVAAGARPPFALLIGPQRYARLLSYSERSGVPDLARVERLARVVQHPLLDADTAYLVPLDPAVLDIVVGVDTEVEYLGPEAGGHRFVARETLALRLQSPRQLVRMKTG